MRCDAIRYDTIRQRQSSSPLHNSDAGSLNNTLLFNGLSNHVVGKHNNFQTKLFIMKWEGLWSRSFPFASMFTSCWRNPSVCLRVIWCSSHSRISRSKLNKNPRHRINISPALSDQTTGEGEQGEPEPQPQPQPQPRHTKTSGLQRCNGSRRIRPETQLRTRRVA